MTLRKISIVTGARSEYGLLYWLMREIKNDPELTLQTIVTGAHLSAEYGMTYRDIEADGFVIDEKVDILSSDNSASGIAKAVGQGVIGFTDAYTRLKPDLVVLLGDRFETLAAAQSALLLHIPIAHIHGGEVTRLAVDESIRHAITKMAQLHFPAAEPYRQRILQMGENPRFVFNCGAPGLDHITRSEKLSKEALQKKLGLHYGPVNFLITYHPVTLDLTASTQELHALLAALKEFPDAGLFFTIPNADEGSRIIREMIEQFVTEDTKRRFLFNALGTVNYLSLARVVDAVVGNSSSGLIEVPYVKTPTINIGERQSGRLLASSVINCRGIATDIINAIHKALSPAFQQTLQNIHLPYGKGDASAKIKDTLKKVSLKNLTIKPFVDIQPTPKRTNDRALMIAEIGVNHNGSMELAYQLIDQAASAGADVVKFQTFTAETLVRLDAPKADYQQKMTGDGSQYEMLKRLELSREDQKKLKDYCQQHNVEFLSSPFDVASVNWLTQELGLKRLKIGSGEITHGPLLLAAAHSGCDIILSTGMSTLADIEQALSVLAFGYLNWQEPSRAAFEKAYADEKGQKLLKEKVTLLHCTSQYPAPFADIHLLALNTLRSEFGLTVGYSDHSVGTEVTIAAVALGASVIEKHVTLDKNLSGPDHQTSLTVAEFADMVKAIRRVEVAMGQPCKMVTNSERNTQRVARKSLVASKKISKGEQFNTDNVTAKRPADGLSPMHYWDLLEKKAEKNYQPDEVIES